MRRKKICPANEWALKSKSSTKHYVERCRICRLLTLNMTFNNSWLTDVTISSIFQMVRLYNCLIVPLLNFFKKINNVDFIEKLLENLYCLSKVGIEWNLPQLLINVSLACKVPICATDLRYPASIASSNKHINSYICTCLLHGHQIVTCSKI